VHELAVGEVDLREIAADLGAQVDLVHGGELPGEVARLRQGALQRQADRDGRRRRRGRDRQRRGLAFADGPEAAPRQGEQHDQGDGAAPAAAASRPVGRRRQGVEGL